MTEAWKDFFDAIRSLTGSERISVRDLEQHAFDDRFGDAVLVLWDKLVRAGAAFPAEVPTQFSPDEQWVLCTLHSNCHWLPDWRRHWPPAHRVHETLHTLLDIRDDVHAIDVPARPLAGELALDLGDALMTRAPTCTLCTGDAIGEDEDGAPTCGAPSCMPVAPL